MWADRRAELTSRSPQSRPNSAALHAWPAAPSSSQVVGRFVVATTRRFVVATTRRFVAGNLMLGGIALLGVVAPTLASWLVERVAESGEFERAATHAQVEALTAVVRALRAEFANPPTLLPHGTE